MNAPLCFPARGRTLSPVEWTIASVLLLVPALVVFVPGLRYPFLAIDDLYHVVQNPAIRDFSWDGIRFLFTEDTRDIRYYPLTYLSYAVDYRLFGLDPFYFHLTNLILHLANTLGVALLVWTLFRDATVALATALLFSIHPLQVEPVAWVMGRKGVLSFFFLLLGVLTYLAYIHFRAARRGLAALGLGASVICFVLSCLAKATGVTMLPVLVGIDFYLFPEKPARLLAFLRRSLPSKLVYLPPMIAIALATRHAAPENPFAAHYPFTAFEWIAITGYDLFFYIEKSFVPVALGVFYPLPAAGALPARFYLFSVGTLALLALLVWSWFRVRRTLFFGLGWYFVTILPSAVILAFYSDLPLLVADRYFYASSVGVFVLVAAGAALLWRGHAGWRPALGGLSVAVVVALTLLASAQRATWQSTTAAYEQLLAHHPSDEFYYRLALEYDAAGRSDDAFRALDAAESAPSKIFFLRFCYYELQLAELYRRKGDFARAAEHLEAAIESTPNTLEPADARTPLAYLYLVDLRERAGDGAGAARAREAARRARPEPTRYFESTWMRAAPAEAGAFLQRRIASDPRDGMAWYFLALHAALAGDDSLAVERERRAVELGYLR